MPGDYSRVRRRMVTILCSGIACLPRRGSCSRLRCSRIRSRSSAVIGRSGRHRRGGFTIGNRSSASGRRRWLRDVTGPGRVLRWRRRADDPRRLIMVEPIAERDDTHDPDSQRCACPRNPKRKAFAPHRQCGLDTSIRLTCIRMRKLGLAGHYTMLRTVSSDPSIRYIHVPSPCGVLIDMRRGTVLRVRPWFRHDNGSRQPGVLS